MRPDIKISTAHGSMDRPSFDTQLTHSRHPQSGSSVAGDAPSRAWRPHVIRTSVRHRVRFWAVHHFHVDVVVALDVLDHMMSCATAANVCPSPRAILGGSSSNEWFSSRKHVFFHTQACGDVGIAHPQGAQIVCQAGDICSVSNPCQNTRSVSK